MTLLHILFPILVVAPVLINGVAMRIDARHGDAFGLSVMILAIWVGQMLISPFATAPERAWLNAAFDTVACLTVLGCWVTYKAPWMLVLTSLYALQVYVACAFLWGWEMFDHAIKYGDYVRLNNVVWIVELVCVSAVGGWGVVRYIRDRLRDPRDHRHPVGGAA